jgi:tetratricopeptide (TPR) repeat protein
MRPVVLVLGFFLASAARGDEAQDLFNQAVVSTNPEQQVGLLTRALTLSPGLEMGYHNLGTAYYRLGKLDQAVSSLNLALDQTPNYPNSHYLLACCYSRLGQSDSALTEIRAAVRDGWREGDMLRADSDLDPIRGAPGFPAVRSRRGRGRSVRSHRPRVRVAEKPEVGTRWRRRPRRRSSEGEVRTGPVNAADAPAGSRKRFKSVKN